MKMILKCICFVFLFFITSLSAQNCTNEIVSDKSVTLDSLFTNALKYWKSDTTCFFLQINSCISKSIEAKNYKIANNGYNKLGEFYRIWGHPNKSIYYYKESIRYAKLTGNNGRVNIATYNLGVIYTETFKQDSVLLVIEPMVVSNPRLRSDKEKFVYTLNLNLLAQSYYNQREYTKAINYYQQGLNIVEKLESEKYKVMIPIFYNNIGLIYSSVYDKGNELKYYNLALSNMDSSHQIWGTVINNIAGIKYLENEYDSTEIYYLQVLTNPNKSQLDSCVGSLGLGNLYLTYPESPDLDKSKMYIEEGINIAIKLQDLHQQILGYFYLGKYYDKIDLYDQANENYLKALHLSESNPNTSFLVEKGEIEFHKLKSGLKKHNLNEFINELSSFRSTTDEIIQTKLLQIVEGEKIKYEVHKIELENDRLQLNNKLLGVLLASVALTFVFLFYMAKHRTLNLKNEKELIEKDRDLSNKLNLKLKEKLLIFENQPKTEQNIREIEESLITILAKGGITHYLKLGEILYVKSNGNYSFVHTSSREPFEVRVKLENVINVYLHESLFVRVHRSYVVQSNLMRESSNSKLDLQGVELKIPIGESYKKVIAFKSPNKVS